MEYDECTAMCYVMKTIIPVHQESRILISLLRFAGDHNMAVVPRRQSHNVSFFTRAGIINC